MHLRFPTPRPRLQGKRLAITTALTLLIAAAIGVICFRGPMAYAKIATNTVDLTAIVSPNGRHIRVTGPLGTDQSQSVLMRVTVTQRSTGAIAEGYTAFTGTLIPQQWQVHAWTLGGKSFEPGPATVVALAQSRVVGSGADDSHQWLVNVTLMED